MTRDLVLGPAERDGLAQKLAASSSVARHDTADERAGWTLAYNFSELEESMRRFLDEQLPRLLSLDVAVVDIDDALHEIGEEFRHILYHLTDSSFYSYLVVCCKD